MTSAKPSPRKPREQRFRFIDFRLFWEGRINRRDLVRRFEISEPQASKDFSEYERQVLKGNGWRYDVREKAYFADKDFRPSRWKPSAREYLTLLRAIADNAIDAKDTDLGFIPPHELVPVPRRPASPKRLRYVIDGIRERLALYLHYQSGSRPEPSWRWISPHALAFDGHRWHVRAWAHDRQAFRDFVLGRILEIKETKPSDVDSAEDDIWHHQVTLELRANPALNQSMQAAVETGYGMQDGRLDLTVRLSLVFYVVNQLRLDLVHYNIPAKHQPLDLINRDEVVAVAKRFDMNIGL